MNGSSKKAQWGLLALRLAAGIVFVYHGWLKLGNMETTVMFFNSLGLPVAGFFAWLVALVEFVGGIALILGVFTSMVAVILAINMIVALLLAHTKMPYQSAELPIMLLASMLALKALGAGKWALMQKDAGCYCGGKYGVHAGASDDKNDDECCGGGCGCCDDHGKEEKKEEKV